jgi:hypothetical protein
MVNTGVFAKITIDNVTVAEMGSYTIAGFNRDTLEKTAFGDTVKKFVAGHVDGGDISFNGFYDIADTDGQKKLITCAEQNTILTPGRLKVYVNANHYFTVGSAGTMFVTKAGGVGMDKAGIGTTDFTVKVAGDSLELVDVSGSLSISTSPSKSPSLSPSLSPSISPSKSPSNSPSISPSLSPSA